MPSSDEPNHTTTTIPTETPSSPDSAQKFNEARYNCYFCTKTFSTRNGLFKHLRQQHPRDNSGNNNNNNYYSRVKEEPETVTPTPTPTINNNCNLKRPLLPTPPVTHPTTHPSPPTPATFPCVRSVITVFENGSAFFEGASTSGWFP
uniref:C2H2-type domain-containing protein n=1 Tax=Steinernema glaseri TaxID=37863 RepID=A0A1I8APT8_9BILA